MDKLTNNFQSDALFSEFGMFFSTFVWHLKKSAVVFRVRYYPSVYLHLCICCKWYKKKISKNKIILILLNLLTIEWNFEYLLYVFSFIILYFIIYFFRFIFIFFYKICSTIKNLRRLRYFYFVLQYILKPTKKKTKCQNNNFWLAVNKDWRTIPDSENRPLLYYIWKSHFFY